MSDDRPLLLHSLREFSSLIFPCLEAAGARTVLEIGSEAGLFTRELCEWANARGGSVTAIEPLPQDAHRSLETELGLRLIVGKSPPALEGLEPFDAYFIDGDHNWWCVTNELRHALSHGHQPLVVLHDVHWPCARRDQYYEPSDIPAEHRHPFSYDGGAVPGEARLARGRGFRGEDAFAYAVEEGGPENGVLTAVEDVLAERPDVEFVRVPVVFGLGVVFPRDAPWADEVRRLAGPFHEHPLLERLESNRMDLFLRHIGPRRAGASTGDLSLLAAQQEEIRALEDEVSRLRLHATGGRCAPRSGGS